jgi:hypothetical protein
MCFLKDYLFLHYMLYLEFGWLLQKFEPYFKLIKYVHEKRGGGVGWGTALQACATSRKVTGSIPDGVEIFHWHNPSSRTMALGLTQPLTEISTTNISWGVKAAGAQGWQPYHLHVPTVLKSGSLNLLKPSGPVQACNGIALPFTKYVHAVMEILTIYVVLDITLTLCCLKYEKLKQCCASLCT